MQSTMASFSAILRRLRRRYRPVYGALVLGTVITLFVLTQLQTTPFFQRAELGAYDAHFQQRGVQTTPQNIVLIGVDTTSVDELSGGHWTWPIARTWYAKAIDFLRRAHARAIGLDFAYLAPSPHGTRDDQTFAAAMRRAGNVVIAEQLNGVSASNFVGAEVSLESPIDILARSAAGVGVANVPTDIDGELRAADLLQAGPGGAEGVGTEQIASLAVKLAGVALHQPVAKVIQGLPQQDMLVNFVGPQNPGDASQQSFLTYQFLGVVRGEDGYKPFQNKIVFIIPAASELKDTFNTPFGLMYGGVTQANALNTILQRDPIIPVGSTGNSLIVLIVGLITTIVASRFGIWRSAAAVLVVFVGYGLLVVFLFDLMRVWINLITPETAVVLSFAAIMALRFATEERQRRMIRKSFGQYVTPEIIDTLVSEPEALQPRRRPISALFVDIRGFTSMSELMEPENVVSALDIYLEELTSSVQRFGGTINKYVGDELVAIWNAPLDQPNHALLAVQSALDMVNRLDDINEQLRTKDLPAIKYGIGVNSGDAVVGRMGSSFREQYDVIGDTVNTGARLCSAAAGGEIIIGEATWQAVGNRLILEETERLRLKGKSAEIRTFRVLGLQNIEQAVPLAAPAPA